MPTRATSNPYAGGGAPASVSSRRRTSRGGTSPLTGASASVQRGALANLSSAQQSHVGAGPAFTPLGAVLTAASIPAFAVGEAIQHPTDLRTWTASGIDRYRDPKLHTLPGQALRERGVLPGGKLGAVLGFGADVALDPTTYLTFGGSSAARTVGNVASRALTEKAARGEAITLRDVARAAAGEQEARAGATRTVSVGLQVPFTRGKKLILAESDALPRDAKRIVNLLTTEGLREKASRGVLGAFQPAAGADKAVYRVGRDVANFANTQMRDITRAATAFQRDLDKTLRRLKIDKPEGYRAVSMAVEQPNRYRELPAELRPFVDRMQSELDAFNEAEKIAGIAKREVPDYLPHRLLNAAERRRFEAQYGTANLDNPFFVKERTFPHIQAGEAAGFKFELNPARLLEVRGHASIQARAKKAFDDEIAATRGEVDVPDTIPADWTPEGEGGVATEVAPGLTQARADWSAYPSKYLTDVRVDPKTREAVLRVHEQITPAMTSDGGMESIIRMANTTTARWKALALASPGFHARNALDDSMRAYWAGARNPKSYVDAGRLVAGKGRRLRLKVDGETLEGDQIVNLAKALGILDQGFSGKEVAAGLAETAGTIKKATTRVRTPGTGRVAQASRVAGDFRENAFRLGTFIERIKAGDSAYEAARVVKEFHMDYGDVGRFVEGARRFWLPFVTFTAKSVPLIGRQIARKPGTLANVNKAMTAANEAAGSPDLSLLATGARSSFAIPTPTWLTEKLGGTPGMPVLYNPERTFSFGILNTLDPTQIKAQPAGLLSPFVKAGIELPTDYRLYYSGDAAKRQRAPWAIQFIQPAAERIPWLASALDYGPKKYRYGNQTVPGYGSKADYILRMFPPFSQASGLIPSEGAPSVGPSLGSWLSGVRLAPYDRARDAYYAQLNKDRQ